MEAAAATMEKIASATEEIASTIRSIQDETRSTLDIMQESRTAVQNGLSETGRARKSLQSTIEASTDKKLSSGWPRSANTIQTSSSSQMTISNILLAPRGFWLNPGRMSYSVLLEIKLLRLESRLK